MEVIDENASMLSNFEIYTLLKDIQQGQHGQKKPSKQQQQLSTISYETIKYLEKTPCKHQSSEIIADFIKALEPFKLSKAEKIQLLNQRPSTAVEIQLLIEESEERLTEEQIEQLLDLILNTLPGDETAEDCSGNEPMEEQS
ncbi:DNA-directed RNA polymerase III subunit RPC9 [Lingula anatina]|uniref:DNA-directed RNA polymerase III subunit RPC9 n=1 Tax=Lingula anatina TaxID=7574 RepID=A0A1S3JGI6_LINAN|nr:DNA-directed RNA polymerase III subunit RPC9 [Lingula anatina]|eukprot:XP_013409009.1 DNA-directed RNA polymerase III subunit RPC9 [Lingula anatina]